MSYKIYDGRDYVPPASRGYDCSDWDPPAVRKDRRLAGLVYEARIDEEEREERRRRQHLADYEKREAAYREAVARFTKSPEYALLLRQSQASMPMPSAHVGPDLAYGERQALAHASGRCPGIDGAYCSDLCDVHGSHVADRSGGLT